MLGDSPAWADFPDLDDIPEAAAPGVPVKVVAVATLRGLVRGVAHFTSHHEILAEVRRTIGVLDVVGDWTKATYHMPAYLGLDGWEVPGGIFLHPWTAETTDWKDPKHREAERVGQLLYVPHGWVHRPASGRPPSSTVQASCPTCDGPQG